MNSSTNDSNLAMWERQGASLLVVQPFMDSVMVRGEGCYLIDVEGRRTLDLAAGQFCSILGHSHKGFIGRLQAQLDNLLHLGDQFISPGVLATAAKLVSISPLKDGKVIILSTGSEANECAMRMAKAVTGRTGMLGYSRGYYGISLATRNLSSISDAAGHVDFQPAPIDQFKLLTPMPRSCPIGLAHESCTMACLDASFETIGHHQSNIAAVIVEPVLSAGGMIFPPKDYLQSLHRRAQAIGALFIVDEAQTGFGRCGRWFDIENYGIVPDMLVVSKTAGNGYPIGAVIVSSDVGHALEAQGFSHLSSHQNDPLAAATIHAVIDTVAEEGLVERSAEIGGYFMDALRRLQSKHEMIVDVRGRGLMIGVELAGRDGNATSLALKTALLCEARGVHLTFSYYEPVLRFIPPLVIEKKDIDLAVAVLDEVFTLLARGNVDLEPLLPKNCRSGPYVRRMNQGLTPGKIVRGLLNTPPRHWFGKFKQVL